MKIQIWPHGAVEVVVPRGTRSATVAGFIADQREWIVSTQARFALKYRESGSLPDRIVLPAIDRNLNVHYLQGAPRCNEQPNALLISGNLMDPASLQVQLRTWLRHHARLHLKRETNRLAQVTGLVPERVHIRLQRTRWGSCSSSGTISLNAALLLRSAEELNYVLIHELCHLRHMNHSRRFWQLVARYQPNYRQMETQLDDAWTDTPLWLLER